MFKDLRVKTGLTQHEAAKKLGLNTSFWCRIEAGDCDLPARHFKKTAKLLRVPVQKLIEVRVTKFRKSLVADVDGRH